MGLHYSLGMKSLGSTYFIVSVSKAGSAKVCAQEVSAPKAQPQFLSIVIFKLGCCNTPVWKAQFVSMVGMRELQQCNCCDCITAGPRSGLVGLTCACPSIAFSWGAWSLCRTPFAKTNKLKKTGSQPFPNYTNNNREKRTHPKQRESWVFPCTLSC